MSRPSRMFVCSILLAVLGASLSMPTAGFAQREVIEVGSKKFTESVILGEIAEGLIASTGRPAGHRAQLGGTRVAWKAIKTGEIDVYPEYTGTIRQEIFADKNIGGIDELREALTEKGIAMTAPLGFENNYALGMKRPQARKLGVETISDLQSHPNLVFGFSNEFMDRHDGWAGLKDYYRLEPAEVRGMDHDLAYRGLANGDLDVIELYTTDAAIQQHDLRLLEDDRSFFPSYQAIFLYRSDLQERAPAVVDRLESVAGKISADEMASMNKRVKIDGESEGAVAARFLERTFGISKGVETEGRAERIWGRTLEHLFMVLVSMAAAIALAIPLGIWAAKQPRIGQGVLGVVGILQTIPSLALLVFMIPLFGIGTWPAIAALFVYSLLPIVRNTYAGLNGISQDVRESARALGLEKSAILRLVELPMAVRSILAGIKTSVVINIGIATLGALIGAGGYGQPILTGIRRYDIGLILEGAVPAAGLAIVAQVVFEGVERVMLPRGLRVDRQ